MLLFMDDHQVRLFFFFAEYKLFLARLILEMGNIHAPDPTIHSLTLYKDVS